MRHHNQFCDAAAGRSTLMAVSEPVKLEREKRKTAREERALALLGDPQVIGLAMLVGGLYIAQRITWSDDEGRNDMLRGIATTGVVLTSLTRAGLTGWPAAAAAGIAGATSIESDKPLIEFKIPDWLKNL
jgi:hypothetical protein